MPISPYTQKVTLTRPEPFPIQYAPAMPFEVNFRGGQKAKVSLETLGDDFAFVFRSKTEEEFIASNYEDPKVLSRTLIEWFLSVKSPQDALIFFGATGHFLWDTWSQDTPEYSVPLTWREFREWQKVILDVSAGGFFAFWKNDSGEICTPENWPEFELSPERKKLFSNLSERVHEALNGVQPELLLQSRPSIHPLLSSKLDTLNAKSDKQNRAARPDELAQLTALRSKLADKFEEKENFWLEIEALTSVEAMLRRIYVESLNEIEFRKCKRKGCGKRFEKKFKHEKNYCSETCSHHDAVANSAKKKQDAPVTTPRRRKDGK